MISNFIEFSIKNQTGIIKLNRPDALNALNYDMATIFLETLLQWKENKNINSVMLHGDCLLYTSPSPRDGLLSRMPSSA